MMVGLSNTPTQQRTHFNSFFLYKFKCNFFKISTFYSFDGFFLVSSLLPRAATFPDELGTSVPLTEEEQRELLYVPLDGEWGCRTRADECERIMKAMDQLCTLGMTSSSPCENNSPLMSCKQGCEVEPRGYISCKAAAA